MDIKSLASALGLAYSIPLSSIPNDNMLEKLLFYAVGGVYQFVQRSMRWQFQLQIPSPSNGKLVKRGRFRLHTVSSLSNLSGLHVILEDLPIGNWTDLPVDILEIVVRKLDSFVDFLSFSCVSRPFHYAYTNVRSGWSSRIPCLMLGEDKGSKHPEVRRFFDPSTNKIYRFEIPKEIIFCWGSSYGWIIALDLDLEIFMFNPFTRAKIMLPSACSLPCPVDPSTIDWDYPMSIKKQCRLKLFKIVLLKVSRKDNKKEGHDEFIAVSISFCGEYLGIARPSDPSWTRIVFHHPSPRRVDDVACVGEYLFLYFTDSPLIAYMKLNGFMSHDQHQPQGPLNWLPKLGNRFSTRDHARKRYLAEVSGNLVAIKRKKDCRYGSYKTTSFVVSQWDFETGKWRYLEGMGQLSIFVGSSSTMAIDHTGINKFETASCGRNCIYFTDDHWDYLMHEDGGHDMGMLGINKVAGINMFDAPNQRVDKVAPFSHPTWFLPKF